MRLFRLRGAHGADECPASLPSAITYESVPGRFGLWTATIDTSAGRISVTRPSLRETREALECRLRDLDEEAKHSVRSRAGD